MEPPVVPFWIPYFGHAFAFWGNPGELMRSAKKKYPTTPFTLVMLGARFHVFSSIEATSAIFGRSRDFLFPPVVASMMHNGLALPTKDTALYESDRNFLHTIHNIYARNLSGEELRMTMGIFQKYFLMQLNILVDDRINGKSEVFFLHETIRKLVFMTSLNTFFGSRIQAGYPSLWKDFQLVDDTLYAGVRTNLAFQLQPHAMEARDRVLQAFDAWVDVELGDCSNQDQIWSEEWGMRLNWEREKLHRQHHFSIRGRSCTHASFLYVATTNAAPLITWFVINLIQSPSLLRKFREEAQSAMVEDGLDVRRLQSSPWIQGLWKESLRLGSTNTSARVLRKDTYLEGYMLRKNSIVLLPVQVLHYDPNVFERPNTFDAERWISTKEEEPETLRRQKKQNASLRPFGGGSSICSGRLLAEQEVLLMAATLLTRFDICIEPDQPIFRHNPRSLGIMSPLEDIRVKFKARGK
ncbi:cytochrome P450 [Bisporella sp. PMI_857]|nr:cytochrome P450 [Bisporella sp. PMI_857]